MNINEQTELHLQMTIKAIQAIAGEIQHDQRTGVSLHSLNHKTIELATNIVAEAQKEKRHADNMKLKRDMFRNISSTLTTIEHRL